MVELNKSDLDELVEEAIVDAYGEDKQLTGFYTMIEENLARGTHRQSIAILDLPLPASPPPGSEWITAYLHWANRR